MLRTLATIGAILWIVVGMTELVSLAPIPEEQIAQNRTKDYKQSQCNEKRSSSPVSSVFCYIGGFVDAYHDDISTVSTVFIAIFTIILGFATWFLYGATRDLVKEAEDTARHQLRAYVYVEAARISDIRAMLQKRGFEIEVVVKNYGQTPAYDANHYAQIAIDRSDNPNLVLNEKFRIKQTIPPDAIQKKFVFNAPLTDAEIEGIKDRSLSLYLFGDIRYIDAFRTDRFTQFRFYIGGSAGWRSDGFMASAKEGNFSD